MAQSLWRDHDLDLRDEYDGEEWAEFVPGPLRPHWGTPRADGRPFPAHSPGLPLLLAPAYAVLGREGGVLLMALIAAATALVCRRLALPLTGDEAASCLAWLAAAGPPLFFFPPRDPGDELRVGHPRPTPRFVLIRFQPGPHPPPCPAAR